MGRMNDMAIELDELLMTVVTAKDNAELDASIHEQGWRSPTEVRVALDALRSGDLPRAALILAGSDGELVSVSEPTA